MNKAKGKKLNKFDLENKRKAKHTLDLDSIIF